MKKQSQTIPYEVWKKKVLSDPKVKKAYDDLEPEFQVASQMIEARLKKKMSQQKLARKVGTGQAVISRLEGMNAHPSLSLLSRVAHALGTKIQITIQ